MRGAHIAVELFGDALLFAPFEFQQHVFLGREMKEESAVRDSGGRDDRSDVGVRHAARLNSAMAAPSRRSRVCRRLVSRADGFSTVAIVRFL